MDYKRDFLKFHDENPDVYEKLVVLARQAKHAGRVQYGVKALFEVLRWSEMMNKRAGEEFKLNNNFTAFYSRMIMDRCQDLRGFFILRGQTYNR